MGLPDRKPGATAEPWTAPGKAFAGALGLTVLATGPLVPSPDAFPALRGYAYAAGALLVLWAASARHRPALTILGGIALAAGLTVSLLGQAQPLASRSALALDCGAAVLLGAVARRPWVAVPFLAIPLLIVASGTAPWGVGHEEFAPAWTTAIGCDCAWLPGLPVALALVGAVLGDAVVRPWPVVRPSALVAILSAAGLMAAGLVVRSVLPPAWPAARLALGHLALVAGLLGWVALAYQAGRRSFVVQAGLAGLLVLVGALHADATLLYPQAFDAMLLVAVAASLLPAILAALGLLVRQWIGQEPPAGGPGVPLALRDQVRPVAGLHVETRQPLAVGGFGARDRPDEFSGIGGGDGGHGDVQRGSE